MNRGITEIARAVIWHTQGSGKSLTMVMLSRYILSELHEYNPKVVVVTDRRTGQTILDIQSYELNAARANWPFGGVNYDGNTDIVTTLVHKFDTASTKQNLLNQGMFSVGG